MPGVTVVAHVLPVTIVVEVVDTWNVFGNVVIARVITIWIVIVGVVEIGVIVTIAPVVLARIAIAKMVVEQSAGLARIDARHYRAGVTLTRNRQHFAFVDATAPALANHLGFAAQRGGDCIAVLI